VVRLTRSARDSRRRLPQGRLVRRVRLRASLRGPSRTPVPH
jgi:hypothetical protein